MAHQAPFSIPPRELGNADIEFVVDENNKRLGTLKISKGSLAWFRGKTHVHGEKMTWAEFDRLMGKHSKHRESR